MHVKIFILSFILLVCALFCWFVRCFVGLCVVLLVCALFCWFVRCFMTMYAEWLYSEI